MTEVTCPVCGASATGRFCSACGGSLPGRVSCSACGNEIPGGGRFCNQCGAAASPGAVASAEAEAPVASAEPRKASSTLPWTIAGLAVLALVIALIFPRTGARQAAQGAPMAAGAPGQQTPAGAGFGDPSAVDISSMTPLERANSLFNRVMQNVSSGDSAQVEFFLPMALAAYGDVPDLDADGHYHVAVLQLADGNPNAARESADSILATADTHLFGLFTAAQAEAALGNTAEARGFYERFMQAFEAESTLARREYSEHSAVIPLMRAEAEEALASAP